MQNNNFDFIKICILKSWDSFMISLVIFIVICDFMPDKSTEMAYISVMGQAIYLIKKINFEKNLNLNLDKIDKFLIKNEIKFRNIIKSFNEHSNIDGNLMNLGEVYFKYSFDLKLIFKLKSYFTDLNTSEKILKEIFLEKSVNCYKKVIDNNPENEKAYLAASMNFIIYGYFSQANEYIQKLLIVHPDSNKAYTYRGIVKSAYNDSNGSIND